MKERTTKVYNCEHCNRHLLSRYWMEKHESKCMKNVHRVCVYCQAVEKYHPDRVLEVINKYVDVKDPKTDSLEDSLFITTEERDRYSEIWTATNATE
jgi:transcription elongation factor Elf1